MQYILYEELLNYLSLFIANLCMPSFMQRWKQSKAFVHEN